MSLASIVQHIDRLAWLTILCGAFWILTEVRLVMKQRSLNTGAKQQDQGSFTLLIWTIALGMTSGFLILVLWPFARFPMVIRSLGLPLFLAGFALRQWAIAVLGRFFTVDVAIHGEQQLIQNGPYRILRHPSYTGFILILLGLGLMGGNPVAMAAVLLAPAPGFVRRVQIEEAALGSAFGDSFQEYARRTWRLIPGIF